METNTQEIADVLLRLEEPFDKDEVKWLVAAYIPRRPQRSCHTVCQSAGVHGQAERSPHCEWMGPAVYGPALFACNQAGSKTRRAQTGKVPGRAAPA